MTRINETFTAILMPFLSLNKALKITKLIANDATNIAIAGMSCIRINNIIPITSKILENIAIILMIFGLISSPLLYLVTRLKMTQQFKLYHNLTKSYMTIRQQK